jgi:glycosyltransferase involved in cell wall biosynthesis
LPLPDAEAAPRILIMIYSLARGGAERMTVELARAWADQGCKVTVLTLASAGTDFFHLDPRVQRFQLSSPSDQKPEAARDFLAPLRRFLEIRRILKSRKPDIVLGMMSTSATYLTAASFGLNIKTFGSERIHPPAMPLGFAKELVRSISYGLLDGVICQTSQSAEWIRKYTTARNVHVIPNHVVYPLPRHEPNISTEVVAPEGRRIVLGVGRLEAQKQFDKLIVSFSRVAQANDDWDLVILGDGYERAGLEDLVNKLGLEGRVFLPGSAGNVGDWYGRADIYVLSSRFEGFPNTLLEAMVHGVAPISFDCPTGPSEMISDGSNGLLIPPNDMDRLTAGMRLLIEDEQLRGRLGGEARSLRKRFDRQKVTSLWLKTFGLDSSVEDDSGPGD